MSCKHNTDRKKDTYKKVNCSDEIVLRGHPSHYHKCYHNKLTCHVNFESIHDFVDKYRCISDLQESFSSIISKRNHISFTMKNIS